MDVFIAKQPIFDQDKNFIKNNPIDSPVGGAFIIQERTNVTFKYVQESG